MKQRIQSVDFLRGFTVVLMILVNTPGDWNHVYSPLLHANWNGLTLADFVFPFFLFIVGISISFVYKSKKDQTDSSVYKKILIRSFKLIALGIFLNAFLPYFPFIKIESMRIPGVLQRIGIIFCIVSILYLNFSKKQLLYISSFIVLAYWLWLAYIPLPNGSLPTLDRGANNWANYVDFLLLKGHIWQPDYDPEGILSTLPSLVTTLIGAFVGEILVSKIKQKLSVLAIIGVCLLILGYVWSLFFPINKALWSSSFVLVTSGYATLFLVLFYYLLDDRAYSFGNLFTYVGANAIIIYFTSSIVSKAFYLIQIQKNISIHAWLFENFFAYSTLDRTFSSLAYALLIVAFYILLAFVLFKNKVFFKV